MLRNKSFGLALVSGALAAIFATPVFSQSTKELEEAQRNTAVLNARIAEMKAKQELAALTKADISNEQAAVDLSSKAVIAAKEPEKPQNPPPQVMAIFGVGKNLFASLQYLNGVRQDVRVGDDIEGGFRVKSITSSRVTLSREGKDVPLAIFSGVVAPRAELKPTSSRRNRGVNAY